MDYIYFDKTSASSNVHKYAEETIKAYMEYKYLLSIPRVQAYDKARRSAITKNKEIYLTEG